VAVLLFVVGSVSAGVLAAALPALPSLFCSLTNLAASLLLHHSLSPPLWQLMIYFGVQALNEEGGRERGISMCTVGAIAFLPGSYATWHLYGAFRNWPGYTYDMVPSYDE
jgi:hypothetical protein